MHQFGFLQAEYFGNAVSSYLFAAVVFLAAVWAFLTARRLIGLGRPSVAADLIDQVRYHEIVVIALDLALRQLELPVKAERAVHIVTTLVIAYRVVGLLTTGVRYAINRTVLSDPADRENYATAQTAVMLARGLIWTGVLLFTLSALGYNVSSVMAGLGIGGIAVALGAQAVLGDLFSAVAIYLDKPFVVGDSIKVGDFSCTVEHIGVKTTRGRADGGELLVFPNSMLTSSRIQNYRQLSQRRAVLNFTLPLGTPPAVLKKIPAQIRTIVNATPDTQFDRAHLTQLKDSGFQFEAVYHVLSSNYGVYMDAQQSVLLTLLEALKVDGIAITAPHSVVVENKNA